MQLVMSPSEESPAAVIPPEAGRPAGRLEARGKFFFSGGEKRYLKGVTYGPFAPALTAPSSPSYRRSLATWRRCASSGPTACARSRRRRRGCWMPPPSAGWGCWPASRGRSKCASSTPGDRGPGSGETVAGAAPAQPRPSGGRRLPRRQRDSARHRPLVRARARRSASSRELGDEVEGRRPGALVGYANFPSTEYLETRLLGLPRLQRLPAPRGGFPPLPRAPADPGRRPAAGAHRARHGLAARRAEEQAAALVWQVRAALEMGAAGAFVFSFTDEWFTGGDDVARLGLRPGGPRAAAEARVRAVRGGTRAAPPAAAEYPEGLRRGLRLQRRDARWTPASPRCWRCATRRTRSIVVDDGSTDRTAADRRRVRRHPR